MKLRAFVSPCWILLLVMALSRYIAAVPEPSEYFTVRIVDAQTGLGVPLVELTTTNQITYYSDSNGVVAFYEPGLMDQTVYFNIKSDGYEFPEDFLHNRGIALKITGGGHAELKIKRTSISERLYRLTGQGIYRDSVMAGLPVPIKEPVLNGQVMGQDGSVAIPYHGKLYWFFGDTARPSYPLGNFGCSGAISDWPSKGGLDPALGVNLSYFVDASGFSRPMLPEANFPGPGPRWMGGLKIVSDDSGTDRLLTDYVRIQDLGHAYERGLAIFNDKTQAFDRLAKFDGDDPMYSACWGGHPVRVNVSGVDYYYQHYFAPFLCRMRADLPHLEDPSSFEGFSPLVPGVRYEKESSRLDRGPEGRLRYAWKPNTPPLTPTQEQELIAAGRMKTGEGLFHLRSLDTDAAVKPGPGSIQWNAFRKRWVMIVKEDEGLVNHGVIWFAEADTPLGPWVYAKEILRHEKYNFYNPVHHPFFDQDGGRVIYFEGTYAGGPDFFAATNQLTPRYDYNQIMYRVALDDPRLVLPVPVYLVRKAHSPALYLLRDDLQAANAWKDVEAIPFFAIPPDANHNGFIPIYSVKTRNGVALRSQPAPMSRALPLFQALPVVPQQSEVPHGLPGSWTCSASTAESSDKTSFALDLRLEGETVLARTPMNAGDSKGTFRNGRLHLVLRSEDDTYMLDGGPKQEALEGTWQSGTRATERGIWRCERSLTPPPHESPAIVPLYEYTNTSDGSFLYSTDPNLSDQGLKRSSQPLCRVWRNPLSQLILDLAVTPVAFDVPTAAAARHQ